MKKSIVRIEWLAFVVAAMCSAPSHSWGATINASSCSQAAVQAAVNSASDGDTVVVPAGDCTWSAAVFITNKTITLQGAGSGTGGTKITYGGSNHTLIAVDAGTKTGKMDISGFWFLGGDPNYWNGTAMQLYGPTGWKNLRVHHNVFDGNKQWTIKGGSNTHGLIDHNTFKGSAFGIMLYGNGASDWASLLTLGTANFFFIEDNTFDWNDFYGSTGVPVMDMDSGGRQVFRNNTVRYGMWETHDKARSGLVSAHAYEIYNNTFFTTTNKWKGIDISAGTGVVWGNTFTGDYSFSIGAIDYKSFDPRSVQLCNGSDPADQNTPGQSGWRCQNQIGSHGEGPTAVGYPLYMWNNTKNGSTVGMICTDGCNHVQAGRDFINNGSTPKPGYTPYPYPHPLQGGTAPPPPPPPSDTTPPTLSSGSPTGTLPAGTTSTTVSVTTNENATCRYSVTAGTSYASMTGTFTTTGGTSHSTTLSGLTNGQTYARYSRCQDTAGNATTADYTVTFSVASASSDTTLPSAPGTPTTSNITSIGLTLNWTASTDNIAITGYRVERCQGSGCTNFAQVGTPTGTTYNDTGLTASTAYRYRVRATDAAGNLSGYSIIASATTGSGGGGPTPLAEGNNGIAASYLGDSNIQSNANVIFADGFESYSSANQLTTNWNSYYQGGNTRIATEAANVFGGAKSVEFTLPQVGSEVSNALVKNVSPTEDTLFVRVYTKFESGFDVVSPGHNGIRIAAQYPGPGQAPNGTNFFLFELENSTYYNETEPGYTHIYTYYPEQRSQYGDHWYPDGKVLPFDATPGNFGSSFVPRPSFIPVRNQWYSYELMVKANTPGQRDGRVAIWIDGNLMADFHNVRVRDISNLKIDQIQLELHSQSSSARPNKKWYDNVVVARSYIGPMSRGTPSPLQAPGNLHVVP